MASSSAARRLSVTRGRILLALGAILGGAVGLAMLVGTPFVGLSWLVAIGVAKLALVASAGLMTGGAALLRIDRRRQERRASDLLAVMKEVGERPNPQ